MIYILTDDEDSIREVLQGPPGLDISKAEAAFYEHNPKSQWPELITYFCSAHGCTVIEHDTHMIRDGYQMPSKPRTGFEALTSQVIDRYLTNSLVDGCPVLIVDPPQVQLHGGY